MVYGKLKGVFSMKPWKFQIFISSPTLLSLFTGLDYWTGILDCMDYWTEDFYFFGQVFMFLNTVI